MKISKNGSEFDVVKRFIGLRLVSVQFVLDYISLGFDAGVSISVLSWPTVMRDGREIYYGDVEYRNCLCDMIGQIVGEIDLSVVGYIEVRMSDGGAILINIKADTPSGESAIVTAPNNFLHVF